jgi:hypothetical protein
VGPAGPTPPETLAFTVWPLVDTWTFWSVTVTSMPISA